ncbi:MAG: tetratricopeptide repeat protein [Pseudomonadota bacterium]
MMRWLVPDESHTVLDLLPTAKDLLRRGMWPQAEVLYRHMVMKDPTQAEALNDLSVVRACQGALVEAEELARQAVLINSKSPVFRTNLAKHLFGLGRLDEAESEVYVALAQDWRHAAAIEALNLMQERRKIDAAGSGELAVADRKAVSAPYRGKLRKAATPTKAVPQQVLDEAYQLFSEHDYDGALHTLRSLEANHPGHPLATLWTALCHFRQNDLKRARRWADKAVTLAPGDHGPRLALGLILQAQLEFAASEEAFQAGMQLAPKNADFHSALAFQKLLAGDWPEGWHLFDKVSHALTKRRLGLADPWKGERLGGETLHLWALEGVGDFMMMARLLPEIEARTGKLVVECDQRLIPLLKRTLSSAELIGLREQAGNAPLKSLGAVQSSDRAVIRHLSPDLHPVDLETGSLQPDQKKVKELRKRYRKRFGGQRLVGLSWYTTSPAQGRARSVLPGDLAPLVAQPGCQFIDLQYRDPARPMDDYELGSGKVYRDTDIDARDDLDGLAAQMAAMDLVITIDNSAAHLAGALGVPAWVLLHQFPDWRWGLRGDSSAWYPSLRLFRQSKPGNWAGVMADMCKELESFCDASRLQRSA